MSCTRNLQPIVALDALCAPGGEIFFELYGLVKINLDHPLSHRQSPFLSVILHLLPRRALHSCRRDLPDRLLLLAPVNIAVETGEGPSIPHGHYLLINPCLLMQYDYDTP